MQGSNLGTVNTEMSKVNMVTVSIELRIYQKRSPLS